MSWLSCDRKYNLYYILLCCIYEWNDGLGPGPSIKTVYQQNIFGGFKSLIWKKNNTEVAYNCVLTASFYKYKHKQIGLWKNTKISHEIQIDPTDNKQ